MFLHEVGFIAYIKVPVFPESPCPAIAGLAGFPWLVRGGSEGETFYNTLKQLCVHGQLMCPGDTFVITVYDTSNLPIDQYSTRCHLHLSQVWDRFCSPK